MAGTSTVRVSPSRSASSTKPCASKRRAQITAAPAERGARITATRPVTWLAGTTRLTRSSSLTAKACV